MSKNAASTWHGFVTGQSEMLESVKAHCEGAVAKGKALLNVLLTGESGIGKTSIATAIATALGGVNDKGEPILLHSFYASPQTRPWQIAQFLSRLEKHSIAFIDEIAALPDGGECLYPAIDRRQVQVFDPETHRLQEQQWTTIPDFCLVAATNEPGKLKPALAARFPLKLTLQPYNDDAMKVIILNRAAEMGVLLSSQAARRIAQASRGIPRNAKHILESLHTILPDLEVEVTKTMMNRHLATLGISSDFNLNANDRNYLGVLARRGGCVSLQVLATQIGLDCVSVTHLESWLIRQELIDVTPRGRTLTSKGREYISQKGFAK
ncbi:MAG: Holliday junction DNA helicase RuvB C-terminal domain-containing protein [bacterium]